MKRSPSSRFTPPSHIQTFPSASFSNPRITKFYIHTRRKFKLHICMSVSRVLALSREDESLPNGMFETVHLLRFYVVMICYNSDVSCDPDSCLNVATFVEDLVALTTLCCILLTFGSRVNTVLHSVDIW